MLKRLRMGMGMRRPSLTTLAAKGCPIHNISGGAFVVGCFEHEDDPSTKAVLIMNYEVLYNLFATIELVVPTGARTREVSQLSGEQMPLRSDTPGLPGLTLLLRPGSGRLIMVGPSSTH